MRFREYISRHFATVLTIIITAITAVVFNILPSVSVSPIDNLIFGAIIALNATFLFDFSKNQDRIIHDLSELKSSLPDNSVYTYFQVDKVAEELMNMVKSGKHEVDLVFFDTQIRTQQQRQVNKMIEFVNYCTDKESIRIRLAFVPSADSIDERIQGIIKSLEKRNESYYAFQESKMTFASFMIVDESYVSIRTPFKNGSRKSYCIIKEPNLCQLYSSWFHILWEESTKIDKDSLECFIENHSDLITKSRIKEYRKKAKEIKNA